MNIALKNIGKRFNKEWIFRNISYDFTIGNAHAVLGTNGSGKSTLLQIISGSASPTEGIINYTIPEELLFKKMAYAAPYLELPEEMTWKEAITFHNQFKSFIEGLSETTVLELSGLTGSSDKQIRNFSSGMKQRAKLTLAILSSAPMLLLDEPTSNLDAHAVKWYQMLVEKYGKDRTIIVCSNYNKDEYSFCTKELVIRAF
jgi:ABC-type multidrug transport system ATPase subunit